MNVNLIRKSFLTGLAAADALPLFHIGCGSWGRTLLNRAGKIGGCELADLSDPDPKALMLSNRLVFAGRGAYSYDGEKTSSDIANALRAMAYRRGWEVAIAPSAA